VRPIVTDRVAWSVGLSVTLVSHAKMAEEIETPFWLRTLPWQPIFGSQWAITLVV